jgi:hypothetical protein
LKAVDAVSQQRRLAPPRNKTVYSYLQPYSCSY